VERNYSRQPLAEPVGAAKEGVHAGLELSKPTNFAENQELATARQIL
jgi:hypothetical protein